MKNYNLKIFQVLLLAIIILVGCKKNELIIDVGEASHQVIFTSEMDFDNTIEVNTTMSFGDISAGVVSREWTFPEGVVDIIDSDNDVTSGEARVTALFTQAGQFEVKLHQEFSENVYVGTTQEETKTKDTTIIVTVLDEIEISITAHYLNADGTLGAELNVSDMASNPIPAGEEVRFTFTGIGEPEFITWNIEGGSPARYTGRETTLDVKYKFLGTYDLSIYGNRSRPFGGDTLSLTDFIEVQPSTAPVTVDKIADRNGNIGIEFSREIDASTLTASDFFVTIQNGLHSVTPSFNSVSVDPNEGNVVVIELAGENIYNDDTIKVTYTQGTLYSLDGVQADGFLEKELVFNKVNLLATNSSVDFSFENSTDLNWPNLAWGAPFDYYNIAVTGDQAYDGLSSLYMQIDPTKGSAIGHVDQNGNSVTFPVSTSKTYELGVWVYVVSVGDPNVGLPPNVRFYWGPDTDWAVTDNPVFSDDTPIGEWFYSKSFVNFATATGPQTFWLRGFNGSNPQPISFYLDNISLSEVTLRP